METVAGDIQGTYSLLLHSVLRGLEKKEGDRLEIHAPVDISKTVLLSQNFPEANVQLFETIYDQWSAFSGNRPDLSIALWGRPLPSQSERAEMRSEVLESPKSWAVLVSERALARREVDLSTSVLRGYPRLVISGFLDVPGIDPKFRAAAVILTNTSNELCRFFEIPAAEPGANRAAVQADLDRLLRMSGGQTEFGFIHRGTISPEESLEVHLFDPRIQARIKDLAGYGSQKRLSDVFELLTARPSMAPKEPVPPQHVVTGRDCVWDTVAAKRPMMSRDERQSLERSISHSGVVELQANDLVLSRINGGVREALPVRRVPTVSSPLFADKSVIVIRPRETISDAELNFYQVFIGSRRFLESIGKATKGKIIHLSTTEFRDAPIPVPHGELTAALEAVSTVRRSFLDLAAESSGLLRTAFDEESAEEAVRSIVRHSQSHRNKLEAVLRVDSLDYAISSFYPYPIARRWREFRVKRAVHGRDHEAYTALLDCYETTLSFCASLAIAYARHTKTPVGALEEIRKKLGSNGAGLGIGDWTSVLQEVSAGKRFREHSRAAPLAEIRDFIIPGSEMDEARKALAQRRNDESHQRRIDRHKLPSEVEKAAEQLEIFLQGAGFLRDVKLEYVLDADWDSIRGEGEATFEILRGDHPVGEIQRFPYSDMELERRSVYVRDARGNRVLLRPFLTRHACIDCGNYSLFHPDVRRDGELKFKAIDHGHLIEVPELIPTLEQVGYL